MPSFLDLRDRLHVLDFIHATLSYLPETDRGRVQEDLDQSHDGTSMSTEELADVARHMGRKTWSVRRAIDGFLATKSGCDEEWRMTVAAVSDSTAHIMERFRHGTVCESIDAVLTHEESASAFRDTERDEIARVRAHVREVIWQSKQKELAPQVKKQETILKDIILRLDALRELAADAPWIQDQVYPKLQRWEDDLYFGGKFLEVKELDEEIKYYREEKELPTEG